MGPEKATRIATNNLMGDLPEQDALDTVDYLYKVRSACVHDGLLDIEKGTVSSAARVVEKMTNALLNKEPFRSANSLKEILAAIDPPPAQLNKKYGLQRTRFSAGVMKVSSWSAASALA
jgi:hypothetical protein